MCTPLMSAACRKKYNQYEVYFDPNACKRRLGLDVDVEDPVAADTVRQRFYVGLHKFVPEIEGDNHRALSGAKRTLDRLKVKILEGWVAAEILQQELHVRHYSWILCQPLLFPTCVSTGFTLVHSHRIAGHSFPWMIMEAMMRSTCGPPCHWMNFAHI